jgi:cytoskeletal protein CcmA (bactofilin family)
MANPRDSLVNSIIGAGSAVNGDIDVDGFLRIDGDLRGSVRVTGKIVVGATGRVDASIRAKSAIIGGIVKGDVYVSERLRILAGGMVIGNVFAPRFEADDGTVVHGDVAVTGRPEEADEELSAFVRTRGDARRFLGRFREDCFAPLPVDEGRSAAPEPVDETAGP